MRVRDLMTTKMFTIRDDKRVLAAEEIMTWAHVRHVPVVDAGGALVGILSHRDILGPPCPRRRPGWRRPSIGRAWPRWT